MMWSHTSRTVTRSVAGRRVASVILTATVFFGLIPPGAARASHEHIVVGCDVAALKAAITAAQQHAGSDTIQLAVGCTYTLTEPDTGAGTDATGLPVITTPVVIEGNGATIERDGEAAAFRIFKVSSTGELTLDGVTVHGGSATRGGGVYNQGGTVSVQNSTFTGNLGNGAAIFNEAPGVAHLSHSLLSGNGVNGGGNGGGLWTSGAATVTNTTIAGNAASAGGAIFANAGVVTVVNSTIASNTSTGSGRGILSNTTTTLQNTILSGHAATTCFGAVVDAGGNVRSPEGDGSCSTIPFGDPKLGLLQDNGGPTHTMALGDGSAAIDAGLAGYCPATDQRGEPRPGPGCDSGAYEAQDAPVPATTSLLFTGDQLVYVGKELTPAARLSSTDPACVGPDHQVTFSITEEDPTGADAVPFSLGSAATDATGHAVATAVSTAGWTPGVYTLQAHFAATAFCEAASDEATLTIADPGDAAHGGGWYSLAGSGRVNFAFTVRAVKDSDPIEHVGRLLLINNGKWRLKGTIDQYGVVDDQGSVRGVGDLYRWDTTADDWVLSESSVAFTASFTDQATGGKGRKKGAPTDTFGIHIDHVLVASDPPRLPNSAPQPLSGGNVAVVQSTDQAGGEGKGKGRPQR